MSIILPFDFNPVDNKESTSSYTVPAGKYCIMTATLSVSAYAVLGAVAGNYTNLSVDTNSATDSVTVVLNLKSGSIVTKTESAATDTDSTSAANTTAVVNATSTAILLVDGVSVSEVNAMASGFFFAEAALQHDATIFGNSNVTWHIAEYNNIT